MRPTVTSRIGFGILGLQILASSALLTLGACNKDAAVHPLSPEAQQVRVEDREPPAGATPLGAIAVTDGEGCKFGGDNGTREGATALLRKSAAERGANFVKITKVTEPYSGHDCVHREYKLEGLSYRLAGTPIAAAPTASAPTASAPTASAPAREVPPPAECTPICSPGYACEAGVCQPLCNPACTTGQICRTDRVCVPATPSP